ncbi:PREDICTED: venom acid phosphatase Acph-1-like, partial [Ceratosolen solmsi marchali]|uniref:acid phosphatase n=1 Tax=Ceratosolen solmsi marchali TaxID=326594 RepID=A0AAJ7DXL2_9HYME
KIIYFWIKILLFSIKILGLLGKDELKLKYVNVVFRHGDRTPDYSETYPTDLNIKSKFYPLGYGELTNRGKLREYELGQLLRDKYNDFLGELYLQQSVYALSTDYTRTKMSLQLVLASLYPPSGVQKWHNKLNWQPIPSMFLTSEQDWLMVPEECLEYIQLRKKIEKTPEVVGKIKQFKGLMQNLTEWTGKPISTTYDIYMLYHLFVAQSFLNLTLPNWTNTVFPYGQLFDAIKLEYEIFSYTTDMRRINGGKLLYKIVKELRNVKSGIADKRRKISLYSGHETNIVALLQTLGVYTPHVPAYSSAIIIEFYEQNSEYFVKVLYYRGVPATLLTQQIPGCEILCPFNKFLDLLKDVIPSQNELRCDKSKTITGNNISDVL